MQEKEELKNKQIILPPLSPLPPLLPLPADSCYISDLLYVTELLSHVLVVEFDDE